MPRRILSEARCEQCFLRREYCYCAEIPRLELKTRVSLIMHWTEFKATTNTGRWVRLALPNSETRLRGEKDRLVDLNGLWDETRQPLFLFPQENSPVLGTIQYDRPVTLIVPDGTWRQAAKVWRREPILRAVPCVRLPEGLPSRYRLRRAPQPHCLSTLEAIARALGILEGKAIETALLRVFDDMVARTLITRSPDSRRGPIDYFNRL